LLNCYVYITCRIICSTENAQHTFWYIFRFNDDDIYLEGGF
jgi:hypothetical protein